MPDLMMINHYLTFLRKQYPEIHMIITYSPTENKLFYRLQYNEIRWDKIIIYESDKNTIDCINLIFMDFLIRTNFKGSETNGNQ